jgi:hypothetical protein
MALSIGGGISFGPGVNLDADGYVTSGLTMLLDAGDSASYPGTGTTWTDLSGAGNNATLQALAPVYVPQAGAEPGYFAFNGTGQTAQVANSNAVSGSNITGGTINCWIKYTTVSAIRVFSIASAASSSTSILGFGMNITSFTGGGTTPGAASGFTRTSSNSVIDFIYNGSYNSGTWINLCFAVSAGGNTRTLYANGVQAYTVTDSNNLLQTASNTGAAIIGMSAANNQFFNGSVGLLSYYNRGITEAEAATNFQAYRRRYGL